MLFLDKRVEVGRPVQRAGYVPGWGGDAAALEGLLRARWIVLEGYGCDQEDSMENDDFCFPDGLYYDEHDQWARLEGDVVVMGLTDYGQSVAGDVVFVDPPQRDTCVWQGRGCGTFESGKWVGRMYAPVSGTVVEVNEKLSRDPQVVNSDPYGEGWIARIKATDPGELGRLMDAGAARALVVAELEGYRAGNTAAEGTDGES